MPIPTRSQSVRGTSAQAKTATSSEQSQTSREPRTTVANTGASSGSGHTVSRIARPGAATRPNAVQISNFGHARSQSTSQAGMPRPGATTRLPVANPSSTIPTPSARGAIHTRSQSVIYPKTGATTGSAQHLQTSTSQPIARVPSQSVRPPPKLKPTFTAYQQHFSPQKPQPSSWSVPDVSTSRGAVSSTNPTKNITSSRLEDELLQLSAVYKDSHSTLRRFEDSVRGRIESSDLALQKEEDAVQALEEQRQADINAAALSRWLQHDTESPRNRSVQNLGFCIAELSELNSEHGLYTHCMQEFDKWLQQVQHTIQKRASQTQMQLVEPIGHTWARNIRELEPRLAVCEHLLTELSEQDCQAGSALAFTLDQYQRLLRTMKSSLAESQAITQAVLSSQQNWVAETISDILLRSSDSHEGLPCRQGVWS